VLKITSKVAIAAGVESIVRLANAFLSRIAALPGERQCAVTPDGHYVAVPHHRGDSFDYGLAQIPSEGGPPPLSIRVRVPLSLTLI
jgi:hypothetical protein